MRRNGIQTATRQEGQSWTIGLTILTACCFAALSAWLQGFQFGRNNNAFHIPIVLRWFDLPVFQNDATIQALRHFATPVFPFLALFTTEANITAVFFGCFLLTRLVTFVALMLLIERLGVVNPWWRVLTMAAICLAVPTYRYSPIGGDGLFIPYFTHTELAQGCALLGLALAVRGRFAASGLASGVAFAINIFVGVWQLGPLGLLCLARLTDGDPPGRLWRDVAACALAFCLPAVPVVVWVLMDQAGTAPLDFDYRAFLWDYVPYHFFISSAAGHDLVTFALTFLSGLLGAWLLPGKRPALLVLAGFAGIFLIGVPVGALSQSRFVLNLHLLRVDGMITWMAILVIATAAVLALSSGRPVRALLGFLTLVALIWAVWSCVLIGLVLLAAATRFEDAIPVPRFVASARMVLLAAVLILPAAALYGGQYRERGPASPIGHPTYGQLTGQWPIMPWWRDVKTWVVANTPADAIFLVPVDMDDFRAGTKRRIWVDWKEGAAGMWLPATHQQWAARYNAVHHLGGVADQIAYACQHGIDYVIWDKRSAAASVTPPDQRPERLVYDNRWFGVLKVGDCVTR